MTAPLRCAVSSTVAVRLLSPRILLPIPAVRLAAQSHACERAAITHACTADEIAVVSADELPATAGRVTAAAGGGGGDLLLFKGYCRWGRQQLAAEFADGKWGACTASLADVLDTPTADLWPHLIESGRLEYAPGLVD